MENDTVKDANDVPEFVARPTKDVCSHASSGNALLSMILAFLESVSGIQWQGQVEGSTFETDPDWTTSRVSLVMRVPTSEVIDEFKE